MARPMYLEGEYAKLNPTWHAEDSPWKAGHIMRLMTRNELAPRTIGEIGCGAGEVLKQLHDRTDESVRLVGYDISPQAHQLSLPRATSRLRFVLKDFLEERNVEFDVILLIDLIEHLEDYFTFLRHVKARSRYTILHIPLDVSVLATARGSFFSTLRKEAGHLHYFSKETALATLRDVDYEIVDYFYTGSAVDLPSTSFKGRLAKLPRKVLFALDQDAAARWLGGFSLMVLAR